jgi:hypothetical protein
VNLRNAARDLFRGRPLLVTVVELVLLLNALPAFVVLSVATGKTDSLFVWTVKPDASARMLAAMYGNAAILALLVLARRGWAWVRVAFVVFTLFSLAATIVTFFHLDPFLAHPRYFFVYWLVNYLFLCLVTPVVFVWQERMHGGRLPVTIRLPAPAQAAALVAAGVLVVTGVLLLTGPGTANGAWPWVLTPLVARILGVWLTALGVAFAWALWDADAARTRPIFQQAAPTALLIALVPLLHRSDLEHGFGHFALFAGLVLSLAAAGTIDLVRAARTAPA